MYSQKNRALRAAPVVSKPDEVQKHMSAQLHCGVGENVGSMGAKPFFDALRTKICANESRKCAYIEVSFELKQRPYKYFMNFYPLYALRRFKQYFLTRRCNQDQERLQKHFARP